MATEGFWGIIKNEKKKIIHIYCDSFPRNLGRNIVFIVQNDLEKIRNIFDKIVFVNDINKLTADEAIYILINPEDIVVDEVKQQYFSESAEKVFKEKDNRLEYGYLIDLDENKLKLFKSGNLVGECNLATVLYKDLEQIFVNN